MQIDDEYFDSKEFKDILASYEESAESGIPMFMDVDDMVDIADYYNYKGKRDMARDIIEQALELYPEATSPLVFKAGEALRDGDIAKAKELAEKVTDRDDPDFRYLEAEILIAENKLDEAERYLLDYYSTISAEEHDDFVLDVANLYVDYGVNDKAYRWIVKAENPGNPDYKELMARTLFGMGKFDDSARIFNELIDENPFSKNYWNALASAQFMNEKFDDSIASSEYAIAIDPKDPDGLLAKANALYRLGKYEEALDYYTRYSDIVPDDEFGLLSQGTCLTYLSQHDKAIEKLRRAEEVAPPDSSFLYPIYQELAFAYSAKKMVREALAYLDKTAGIECDKADVDVLRGHILLENGFTEEAEQVFRQTIAEAQNAPDIILRVTVSLYDNKFLDAAYRMLKKLFALTEGDYDKGYSYMALCCWDLKKADEFIHYLAIAVKRNPQEAKVVLDGLFPKEMEVKDYLNYMINKLKP
ncbi:MAG: tetratricopeptide repeat protein [Prevotella sp.]|nr:tetratricopeptide repeat protein [Prevotella sp.]